MEKSLTVLLVEDDQKACQEMIACIDALCDMTLIGITNNAARAIEYIRDYLPDAVILDLELHYGSGNGLLVLQELKQMLLPVKPYVLITTNNSSTPTYEAARRLGADFILSKHQEGYTAKSAVDFLQIMKPVIQSRVGAASPEHAAAEAPANREKRLRQRITSELNLVGISPKVVGYLYLTEAILLVIDHPMQNLSSVIGAKFNKTNSSVERAMQNAINKAWRSSDIEDLLTYYTARINSDKGVPTITEFVYYYAGKIKNEY